MNRDPKAPYRRPLNPAWRPAIERLENALEQNAPEDNSEKIELLGQAMFGVMWRPQPPTDSNSK